MISKRGNGHKLSVVYKKECRGKTEKGTRKG